MIERSNTEKDSKEKYKPKRKHDDNELKGKIIPLTIL